MRYLDIKQMLLATTLNQTGSLTQTGKQLHLSQPAISHQLKALEEYIGAPVFERRGKRLIASPIGKLLAERSQQILKDIEHVMIETKQIIEGHAGTIRLAVECYTCYNWLPTIIREFYELYPNVTIDIRPDATANVHQRLAESSIDIGIVATGKDHDGLFCQPIFSDDLVILMNKEHRLADKKILTLDLLVDEHWILYSGTRQKYASDLFLAGGVSAPRKVTELQLTEAIVEWVKNGLGISLMAKWAARPYLSPQSSIITIPLQSGSFCCRDWYAATIYENPPQAWQALIEIIAKNPPTQAAYG